LKSVTVHDKRYERNVQHKTMHLQQKDTSLMAFFPGQPR